jgi:cytochrome c biogenesis protein CcmG, thiol:disulfide interchange protein DsbE
MSSDRVKLPARRPLTPTRLAVTALVTAAVVAFAIFGLAGTSAGERVAPALPARYLSGPHVTLATLLAQAHGRRTLVNFWASWCTPCAQEAPALQRFASSQAGRGRIVGVDFSEEPTAALAFIHRYGWTFANLSDTYGAVGNEYRVPNLPTTFVIDASGRIVGKLRGPQTLASLTHALGGA